MQLISGKGSNDAITKVATGVADFGEGGLDALLRARLTSNVPVTAVHAGVQQGAGRPVHHHCERHQDAEGPCRQEGRDLAVHVLERTLAVPVAHERRRSRQGDADQDRPEYAGADARHGSGRRDHSIRHQRAGHVAHRRRRQEDLRHDPVGRVRACRLLERAVRFQQDAKQAARRGGALHQGAEEGRGDDARTRTRRRPPSRPVSRRSIRRSPPRS